MEPEACTAAQTLLIIGPQPPPIGGATVLLQAILDELTSHDSIRVTAVNTSPPHGRIDAKGRIDSEKLPRMASILRRCAQGIRHSGSVLVFASNQFILTAVPLLLLLARWHHKPLYLRPFGGALDLYLQAQKGPVRRYLLTTLRAADGILAETRQLQAALIRLRCTHTHYVPGCRPAPQVPPSTRVDSREMRLIFLSHIYRQKGAMVLLEALGILAREHGPKVSCDFYGPIVEGREEFLRQLEATPGSRYCGMVQPGTGTGLIAAYDVFVLPTYAVTEGHPGVIIEAMQAGVPVISTQLRAIPELITHGENGFLVPPQDSRALAEAIRQIALDSPLRERMSRASWRRGQEFRPDVVVSKMLAIVFRERRAGVVR